MKIKDRYCACLKFYIPKQMRLFYVCPMGSVGKRNCKMANIEVRAEELFHAILYKQS